MLVYGITTSAATRIAPRGIAGERLSRVAAGRVGAIVGDVARLPRPGTATLQHYDRVVRALWSSRPSLLPARFGTRFADADDLRRVLRARGERLAGDLRRVRGRAQMNIRVLGVPPIEASGPPASSGDGGTAYLRGRAAEARRQRHVPGFDAVRARVARFVRGEEVERWPQGATVYHLVPRAAAGAYRAAVERAAADAGLRVVVTGPHPPYAFA